MTRECDERMWNLAYRLARSGEHRNYQAIEWELRAFGYPQARQLLDHERVRGRLDSMCAEAQRISSAGRPCEALVIGKPVRPDEQVSNVSHRQARPLSSSPM